MKKIGTYEILSFAKDGDFADLYANHEVFKSLTNDSILSMLKAIYPERELYKIGLGWRESKDYILKARGLGGDVIVIWY